MTKKRFSDLKGDQSSPFAGVLSLCVILFSAYVFYKCTSATDVEILPGDNYFFVSFAIVLGGMVYVIRSNKLIHYESIKEIFTSKDVSLVKKVELILAVIAASYFLFSNLYGFFYPSSFNGSINLSWLDSRTGFLQAIIGLAVLLFGTVLIFGGVVLFLSFGTLFSALSLAIAFHNWANGGDFDFSTFYEIMINETLSDFQGLLLNIFFLVFGWISNR